MLNIVKGTLGRTKIINFFQQKLIRPDINNFSEIEIMDINFTRNFVPSVVDEDLFFDIELQKRL